MADPTQKEMLQTLVRDVSYIKKKQGEMKEKQDDMDLVQNDMLIELKGTSIEPGRGVVARLIQVEKCISIIKRDRSKLIAWGSMIILVLNGLVLLIASWVKSKITGG